MELQLARSHDRINSGKLGVVLLPWQEFSDKTAWPSPAAEFYGRIIHIEYDRDNAVTSSNRW